MSEWTEIKRGHLAGGLRKLKPSGWQEIQLYRHEADAIFDELCRLGNFATLLGEPSPAEMAGIDGHGHDIECDGTADCKARKHVRCDSTALAAASRTATGEDA